MFMYDCFPLLCKHTCTGIDLPHTLSNDCIAVSDLIAKAASTSFLKEAPLSATSPATDAAPSARSVVRDA